MTSEESQKSAPLTTAQRCQLMWQIYQVILADTGVGAAPPPMDELPSELEASAVAPAPATADRDASRARPARKAA